MRFSLWFFRFYFCLFSSSLSAQLIFEKTVGQQGCYEEGLTLAVWNDSVWVSGFSSCNPPQTPWTSFQWLFDDSGHLLFTDQGNFYSGRIIRSGIDGGFWFAGGNRPNLVYDSLMITRLDAQRQGQWFRKIGFSGCQAFLYDAVEDSAGILWLTGIFTEECQPGINPLSVFLMAYQPDGSRVLFKMYNSFASQSVFQLHPSPNGWLLGGWRNVPLQIREGWWLEVDRQGMILRSITPTPQRQFSEIYGLSYWGNDRYGFLARAPSDSLWWVLARADGSSIQEHWLGFACGGTSFRLMPTLDGHWLALYYGSLSDGGSCQSFLAKADPNLRILWERPFNAVVRSVIEADSGRFYLAGYQIQTDFRPDVWIARWDTSHRLFIDVPSIKTKPWWQVYHSPKGWHVIPQNKGTEKPHSYLWNSQGVKIDHQLEMTDEGYLIQTSAEAGLYWLHLIGSNVPPLTERLMKWNDR